MDRNVLRLQKKLSLSGKLGFRSCCNICFLREVEKNFMVIYKRTLSSYYSHKKRMEQAVFDFF